MLLPCAGGAEDKAGFGPAWPLPPPNRNFFNAAVASSDEVF